MRASWLLMIATLLLPAAAWAQGLRPPPRPPELEPDVHAGSRHPDPVEPMGPGSTLPYEPGQPVPDGYRVESGFHTALLAGGGALFGFSYVLSIVVARAGDDAEASAAAEGLGGEVNEEDASDRRPLYVPLFGPFVALAAHKRSGGEVALLIADGVAQGAGFTLAMVGLATRQHWLEPVDDDQLSLSVGPTGAQLTVSF